LTATWIEPRIEGTQGRGLTGGRLGRRLFALALLALVAGLAFAVPSGTAEDSPYLNVWVHYDYMVAPDHSDAPNTAAIQMVVDAFKAHGVTLHIDPQHAAIPARRVIVPDWQSFYARRPGFDDPSCTGPDSVLFSDLKRQYFQPKSNHPWHYAVFGDYVFTDALVDSVNCPPTGEAGGDHPAPGMTGDSQIGFEDVLGGLAYSFVVTLQGLRDAGIDLNAPANARYEAAVFMHELGHNLGLCHGGPNLGGGCELPSLPFVTTLDNYKPNYISVMNYAFQFGIPFAATSGSTTIAGWRVDYSDAKLPDLDEASLDEATGLQDTAHPTDITHKYGRTRLYPVLGPVDWNENGTTTDTGIQVNLNDDPNITVLTGADDWAWLHSRLTPPAVTNLITDPPTRVGTDIAVVGVNLMLPATVMFPGGASVIVGANWPSLGVDFHYDMSPDTSVSVTVPPGAKSGPITVVTAEGKATSSQSLTITP
jgi:hypothetical protein